MLAHRLSAGGRHRVLLLEAGGSDRRLRVQMPIGYGMSFYDPRLNWMYRTEPEPALAGRRGYWPRGKVLGGSSSINAMVFVRGQPDDFDDWRARGNPGWGWDDVLPYFRQAGRQSTRGPTRWRGHDGPLHVSDVSRPGAPAVRRASCAPAPSWACRTTPTSTAPAQEGVGLYEITTRGGRRMSSARAYLHPALKRANLVVQTQAQVTRIVFDGTRASGVHYRHRGSEPPCGARGREVILCAGAINSPLLLQASGVGPAALLQSLGIAGRAGPAGRRPAPAGPPVHRPPVPLARADAQRRAAALVAASCAPRCATWRRGAVRWR